MCVHDSKILYYLNDRLRDVIIFVGFWRSPMPPPSLDATILNYLSDSERGAPLSFVGFWRPPMTPPPDATILYYLNDRKRGAPVSFRRILAPPRIRPQCPPPTIPKYFTILMTEMRDAIIFVGFWRPPPPPLTPQYLTILMTERGGAIIIL